MPNYTYKARDRNGNAVQGSVVSADVNTAREVLRERNLYLTSATTQSDAVDSNLAQSRRTGKRVKINDMVVMSRQLASLVRAGIPINEALYTVSAQSENPYLIEVLAQVRRDILGGSSFTEAVTRHPNVFPELYVALIRAGEAGGVLDETLETAAEQFDKEAELREKVKTAFAYPIIVLITAVGVVSFLIIFVIPRFKQFYDAFGAELPAITLSLITISDIFLNIWWDVFFLVTGVVIFFALQRYIKTPGGRRRFDALKLKMPLFGKLNRKIAIARLTRTLSAMVRAGVPSLQSLMIASRVANNVIIAEAMTKVAEFVQQGSRLWKPMEETGQFPPMVTRMIAAGEESGNLDEMLAELTRFYDRDVEYTVQKLTRMLEPLLTVAIGGVVLFVLLALYMPIFNLSNVIKR